MKLTSQSFAASLLFLCFAARSVAQLTESRIVNLSILTSVTATEPTFIVGTVIGGIGTTGGKQILLRAAGPSLTALGLAAPLDDPNLNVLSGQTIVGSNDNWGGTAQLSSLFAQVGAFAYSSASSRDAAVFGSNFAPGAYTAQVNGRPGSSGTVIFELYDVTLPSTLLPTTPRLINVSVLKMIPAGQGLTAGFVIAGATRKQVLVRAVGPTLGTAPFNISGAMIDPKVDLFSGQTVIASNDNWGGTSALSTVFTDVGAFALPSTSRDAALLQELQPGAYTARVSDLNNSGGIALVEVYEVTKYVPPPALASSQPDLRITAATTAFSVTATGTGLSYQWQRLPKGATAWLTLLDGASITGATTPTLTIGTGAAVATGDQFRVVVSAPAGAVTSDAETYVTNSLLQEARLFEGPYPPLSPVVYMTKAGVVLTTQAYPGLVNILVGTETPEAIVAQAANASGGQVVGKVPLIGSYLIQVARGNERRLLTEIYSNSFVLDGSPATPVVRAGAKVAMDYYASDPDGPFVPCYQLHGIYVSEIMNRTGGKATEIDMTRRSSSIQDVNREMVRGLERAWASGEHAVINMSIQSGASGNADSSDKTGCSDSVCHEIRHQQLLYFHLQLQAIETAVRTRPAVADNAIVVLVAGNAGIEMDAELTALRNRFPNAFKRVKIVGAADSRGVIAKDMNHLTNNSDNLMAYARGVDVKVGSSTTCSGTSYAGPEVARILDYIWSQSPASTSSEVVAAFEAALKADSSNNVVPSDGNGMALSSFLERAIAIAKTSASTATFSLNASTAGPGSITAAPSGSSFPAGTVVRLTAVPTNNSTFVNWSGDLSGSTTSQTITMNGNKSVVANFSPLYTLTIARAGTGGGSVTASPAGSSYAAGTVVTLSATPSSGSTFAGWSGDISGTGQTQALTMNAPKSVTATFNTSSNPLTGTWRGTWAWSGPGPNGCTFNDGGSLILTLTQNGNSVTGSVQAGGVQTRNNLTCALMSTDSLSGSFSGTLNGAILTFTLNLQGTAGSLNFPGTATLSGLNLVTTLFKRDSGGAGSFSVVKQ
jgi:hypothetical protein